MTVQSIPLSHIDIGSGRRAVSRPVVKELAASIREVGLLAPIAVFPVGDAFELVAGRHRVEAAKSLGWTEIDAVLVDLDDVQRQLAEIDENLVRCSMNAADTARQTARRKELYLRLHPETARGVAGARASNAAQGRGDATADSAVASFTADTAAKTGRSVRSIREDAQIGESISDEIFEAIQDTPLADSKIDLLNLARLTDEQQRDVIADADLTDKASVRVEIEKRRSPRHVETQEFADDYAEQFDQDPGDDFPVDTDPDAIDEQPAAPATPRTNGHTSFSEGLGGSKSKGKGGSAGTNSDAGTWHPVEVDGKTPQAIYPLPQETVNFIDSHLTGEAFDEFDRLYQELKRGVLRRRHMNGELTPTPTARTLTDVDADVAQLTPSQQMAEVSRIFERLPVEMKRNIAKMATTAVDRIDNPAALAATWGR